MITISTTCSLLSPFVCVNCRVESGEYVRSVFPVVPLLEGYVTAPGSTIPPPLKQEHRALTEPRPTSTPLPLSHCILYCAHYLNERNFAVILPPSKPLSPPPRSLFHQPLYQLPKQPLTCGGSWRGKQRGNGEEGGEGGEERMREG